MAEIGSVGREAACLRYGTPAGRITLLATVLGSTMVFVDATAVNVALPALADDLSTGFSGLQWTINVYLLVLGGFLMLGGSLGDLYGRRRVFSLGLVGFAGASALCSLAPTIELLIAGRALQGLAGALLVPGSLAILNASFDPADRPRAIGAWSALSALSTAAGPFLAGWLVDAASWRLVFLINLPVAALALVLALRGVPETRDLAAGRLDVPGAATCALGLGALIWAPIEAPVRGWTHPSVLGGLVLGTLLLGVFVVLEARSRAPMLPLRLFRSRQFTGTNILTLLVYGALSVAIFLLVLVLQRALGYSALVSGASLFPVTLLLLTLSPQVGRLTQRIGPRLPLTLGPILAGVGLALLARVGPGESYLVTVLPGVSVFGLGMALTVTPLVSAVLGSVERRHSGIASGVNNSASRLAGLVAVALIPLVAGLAGAEQVEGPRLVEGFQRSMLISGALCVAGGLVGLATVEGSLSLRGLRRPGPAAEAGLVPPPAGLAPPGFVDVPPADAPPDPDDAE